MFCNKSQTQEDKRLVHLGGAIIHSSKCKLLALSEFSRERRIKRGIGSQGMPKSGREQAKWSTVLVSLVEELMDIDLRLRLGDSGFD